MKMLSGVWMAMSAAKPDEEPVLSPSPLPAVGEMRETVPRISPLAASLVMEAGMPTCTLLMAYSGMLTESTSWSVD